jgi:hypothetical protein
VSLKIPVTLPGIDPRSVRLVAQRLNHDATPGTPPANMQLQIHSEGQLSPTVNVAGA